MKIKPCCLANAELHSISYQSTTFLLNIACWHKLPSKQATITLKTLFIFSLPLQTIWQTCLENQIDWCGNEKQEWNVLSFQNKTTNKGEMRFRFKTKWQTSHEIAFDSKQNGNHALKLFSTRVEIENNT